LAKDDLEFNFSFDDSGDQSSYVWSERNGQRYLASVDEHVHKFYELYVKSRCISNHLDFIFAKMNWVGKPGCVQKSDSYEGDDDIATFHCSPLNIAFNAVFAFLENIFDIATRGDSPLSRRHYFSMYRLIDAMLRESMCGIFSIDSADYVLATCHFKRVMRGANSMLFVCNDLLSSADDATGLLVDVRTAMFDIRELSWHAISLCDSIGE
jgi:hypothetical protein